MNPKMKRKTKVLISSVLICILSFLLMIIYIPKIMGYQSFYIQSGSMSPSIPKGSYVFVKRAEFEKISVGDVVTFRNNEETEFFTHRVVDIDATNKMFTTKGDANKENDPSETSYYFAVGRVDFSIPVVGYIAEFFNKTVGKVVLASVYIAWIAIEIEFIVMKRKAPQED